MSGIGHLAAGFAPSLPPLRFRCGIIGGGWKPTSSCTFYSPPWPRAKVCHYDEFEQWGSAFDLRIEPLVPRFFHVHRVVSGGCGDCFLVLPATPDGGVIGLVVFSHWVLDFLMHSNLPLFFDGSVLSRPRPREFRPWFHLLTALDLPWPLQGLAVYLVSRKTNDRYGQCIMEESHHVGHKDLLAD